MKNPWPMFCVLVVTGLLCVLFPQHVVWLLVLATVILFLAWVLLPIKFDDWFAQKINPCIQAYQRDHDFEKLEIALNRLYPWALTKTAKNTVQINLFCAFLEQERGEDAKKVLERIHNEAKTAIDWMNYHLLMAEYAKRIGDRNLENIERSLSEELKSNIERTQSNPKQPATAQQCRTSFLNWISFATCLFFSGSIWIFAFRNSELTSVGAGAVMLSWFAFPVAVIWMVLWRVRKNREKTDRNK